MKVLGLTGRAGVGKDTLAAHLERQYGFTRMSFAGPLKAMLRAIGVTDDRETKELPHPVFGVSPRHMMQTLGTDWMRDRVCEDGWLRVAREGLLALPSTARVVFTDVRFSNEAKMLRDEFGGRIVEIHRLIGPVRAHPSELGVAPHLVNHGLYNGSSIENFYRAFDFLWNDTLSQMEG